MQRYKIFDSHGPSGDLQARFREHNSLADGLSKKALNLELGHGYLSEFLDGMAINEGHFVLF